MATGEKPYRVYRGGRTKGQGAARPAAAAARARAGRTRAPRAAEGPAPAPALELEAADRRRRCSSARAPRSCGRSRAISPSAAGSRRPTTRLEQTSGADRVLATQDGAAALEPDDDPPARARPREHRPARRRSTTPTRSWSSAPTRAATGWRTSRSRATCACRFRATASRRSTPRMQLGGPTLVHPHDREPHRHALQINHVMIVDFANFKDLIDNIGGIDINVPAPILSNKFDCPYGATGCAHWKGWRFAQGLAAHGRTARRSSTRASVKTSSTQRDTDISRGERQQAVLRAALHKLLGFGTFVKLPFNGKKPAQAADDRPLRVAVRAARAGCMKRADDGNALHCRLGGTATSIGGRRDRRHARTTSPWSQMVTGARRRSRRAPGSGALRAGLRRRQPGVQR